MLPMSGALGAPAVPTGQGRVGCTSQSRAGWGVRQRSVSTLAASSCPGLLSTQQQLLTVPQYQQSPLHPYQDGGMGLRYQLRVLGHASRMLTRAASCGSNATTPQLTTISARPFTSRPASPACAHSKGLPCLPRVRSLGLAGVQTEARTSTIASALSPVAAAAWQKVTSSCSSSSAATSRGLSGGPWVEGPLQQQPLWGARGLSTGVRVQANGSTPPAKKKQKQAQQQQQQQQQQQEVQQPQQQEPAGNSSVVRYSPLHYNIEEFVGKVVPTEGERRQRQEVIDAIRSAVRKVWPNTRAVDLQVFGSFANGLSTWNSDLDLVVTGVMEPDRITGFYDPQDKARITAKLRKISEALSRQRSSTLDLSYQQLIPRARIPILKLRTRGTRIAVDVSVSDDSGPRAARYMAQQCRAYPPLKPLVLVLKAYLKACRLNEVMTGGLSSYSLTNMVLAHLQEELKSGHDISDLGETLYTFLLRYGEELDYTNQAVSVASGGIVPKMSLGFAMDSARLAAATMDSYDGAAPWSERLCVDCPLTGRDVSNGTYRIDLVRGAFVSAARKLEALARGRRITDTSLNYLQALFDVSRVLKRGTPDGSQYEDTYLKVVGHRGGEEEDAEDLAAGGALGAASDGSDDGEALSDDEWPGPGAGAGGARGGEDGVGGDYMERQPSGRAAGARQQGGRR